MKGLGDKFTPALRAKLKAAGLDVAKMPPAVPAGEMPKYMYLIVDEVWPDEPRLEQLRLLGVLAIRGWSESSRAAHHLYHQGHQCTCEV